MYQSVELQKRKHEIKANTTGTGEMAQWLGTIVALTTGPGFSSRIYVLTQSM